MAAIASHWGISSWLPYLGEGDSFVAPISLARERWTKAPFPGESWNCFAPAGDPLLDCLDPALDPYLDMLLFSSCLSSIACLVSSTQCVASLFSTFSSYFMGCLTAPITLSFYFLPLPRMCDCSSAACWSFATFFFTTSWVSTWSKNASGFFLMRL